MEPTPPALADRFFTTASPRKHQINLFSLKKTLGCYNRDEPYTK